MVSVQEQQSSFSSAGEKTRRIVLAGNPNVGKSALFNALTGLNAEVSNYPGTTIDIARGRLDQNELADTPGVYGVSSFNDEERIARSMILDADCIINVVSALSLDRDLFLTLQLCDMGKPMMLVVNQWDEAGTRGIKIDLPLLEQILHIPVIPSVAVQKKGIDEIRQSVSACRIGPPGPLVVRLTKGLIESGIGADYALLAAEDDLPSATACGAKILGARAEIYKDRRDRVNAIVQKVVIQNELKKQLSADIGNLLLHPVYGGLISLFVCYLIFYQLLGIFVAGNVVDITEKQLMQVYCEPAVRRSVSMIFPVTIGVEEKKYDFPQGRLLGSAEVSAACEEAERKIAGKDIRYDFWSHHNLLGMVGNILAGEYGIFTLTITYLLGLLFPLVLAFYFGLSLLEDSGYLPRLAVLVDRFMNRIGLTGRAIIPLILGLGCVTMATVTTRLLSSPREKIIATALLGIAIPCSAQLGIVSGTLARAGGLLPWVAYGIVVTIMLAGTGLLLNRLMPGKSGSLMIDLPPMRLPRAENVLKKTWSKSFNFMLESIPMFCLAGLVVSIGQMTGLLTLCISFLHPLVVNLLGLPADPRIATTFILGIVRRDFAAFGLTDVALTPVQAVVAMIVITLFVPCIATVGVMIKERGIKVAMSIWIGSWLFAFMIGGLLSRLLPPVFKFFGS